MVTQWQNILNLEGKPSLRLSSLLYSNLLDHRGQVTYSLRHMVFRSIIGLHNFEVSFQLEFFVFVYQNKLTTLIYNLEIMSAVSRSAWGDLYMSDKETINFKGFLFGAHLLIMVRTNYCASVICDFSSTPSQWHSSVSVSFCCIYKMSVQLFMKIEF